METKFNTFDRVLSRSSHDGEWGIDWYEKYDTKKKCHRTMMWTNCEVIPYEGNEHLIGTTDDYVPPYEPKDGDFITITNERIHAGMKWVVIFKERAGIDINSYAIMFTQPTDKPVIADGFIKEYSDDSIRLSTEEEKKQLLDGLHKEDKDWDADKKEIVDYKWKPKEEEPIRRIEFDCNLIAFLAVERNYNNASMAIAYHKGLIFKLDDEKAWDKARRMTEAIRYVK